MPHSAVDLALFDPADPDLAAPGRSNRKRQIHPESAVQKGVKRAVSRAVACEHEFVCHDRGAEHNPGSHVWEKERGYRTSWLDTEIVLDGGRTFRCELKAPNWSPPRPELQAFAHWDGQARMIERLRKLGHPAAWASSVTMYLEAAHAAGVPLRANWRTVGAHEDALVAADIRRQIEKRDQAAAGTGKKRRPFVPKPSLGRIRRVNAVRSRVLF